MLNRYRFVPVLTIIDKDLVKTKEFKNPRYIGDAINTVKIFNGKFVDELVILDIRANQKDNGPNFDYLQEISNEAFIPLSYGGGVKSLEDMTKLFRIGFEKIIINTNFIDDFEFIKHAVKSFGSQSIVAAIDVKKDIFGNYHTYSNSGFSKTKYDYLNLAKLYENLGVGELLVTSINNDGSMKGYDTKIIKEISKNVNIPIIANGGADSLESLKSIINDHGASAAAASSFFVFYGKHKAVLISFPTDIHEF